jgi:hypothetical protein
MTEPRPARRYLLVGIVLGLAIGLPLGFLAGHPRRPDPWVDAGADWIRLPQQQLMGFAPQSFTVPAKAYDYGAITKPLSALVGRDPSVIKVDLAVTAGRVGVSLAKPDGSALMSKEAAVTPADGQASVYFRIAPNSAPVSILLRNYDDSGVAGAGAVTKVTVASTADLRKKDMAAINRAGLN